MGTGSVGVCVDEREGSKLEKEQASQPAQRTSFLNTEWPAVSCRVCGGSGATGVDVAHPVCYLIQTYCADERLVWMAEKSCQARPAVRP